MTIKNAPIPRSCRECDSWGLSDVVVIDCPVDKDGSLYSFSGRPEGCPLTQDQEPSATTPTADVAPVRHGQNIDYTVREHCEFKCSVCGVELSSVYGGDNHLGMDGGYFNYCPNCGAKMDGEA